MNNNVGVLTYPMMRNIFVSLQNRRQDMCAQTVRDVMTNIVGLNKDAIDSAYNSVFDERRRPVAPNYGAYANIAGGRRRTRRARRFGKN